MTYCIETYGCQMNVAESASYESILSARGWTPAEAASEPDMVLINTCSVRETAETRVWGRLAYWVARKAAFPVTIVVAGCMAARVAEKLREAGADRIFPPEHKELFTEIIDSIAGYSDGKVPPPPLDAATAESAGIGETARFLPQYGSGGTKASVFLPIMHGCDNFCAYCIVPYVRGREVSRAPSAILSELDAAAERGAVEVTLLGQNVNSYRAEEGGVAVDCQRRGAYPAPWGEKCFAKRSSVCTPESNSSWASNIPRPLGRGYVDFPALLEKIAAHITKNKRGIRWLRFLSSHPKDFDARTIEVLAENPLFPPHIHLCVQHGSDAILRAMNRRYTRTEFLSLIARLRAAIPELSISTDILVGFPGESEDDVQQLLDLMDEVRFSESFMYHYNVRAGTRAAELPNHIPREVKIERLERVIAKQKEITAARLKSRLGSRVNALVDSVSRKNSAEFLAHTEHNERVVLRGHPSLIGTFTPLTLASLHGTTFRTA